MIFKLCMLAALVAVVSCEYNKASSSSYVQTAPSYGHQAYSEGHGHSYEHKDEYAHAHTHPEYKFAYEVHDPHTHDVKAQEESRDGHHVKGFYSLLEADGSKRVVHYADNGHGFEAVVQKQGGHHHYPTTAHASTHYAAPVHDNYHY